MNTTWEALIALADRLEPEARRRFLEAVTTLRDSIDIDKIARAVATGERLPGTLLASGGDFATALEPLVDVAARALQGGGRLAGQELSAQLNLSMRFDLVNPLAVQAARQLAANLVSQITLETQLAIRNIITRAFTEGLTAVQAAGLIRPLIGLTNNQAMAVMNYRTGLLESGVSPARAEVLAARYADRQLRLRANNVSRTEIMTASNAGQVAMWQQAIGKGLLDPNGSVKWVVTPDDRLCPRCAAMDGQIVKLGAQFTSPVDGRVVPYPPEHVNCRCVVVLAIRSAKRAA
jgi:hypothetical protein